MAEWPPKKPSIFRAKPKPKLRPAISAGNMYGQEVTFPGSRTNATPGSGPMRGASKALPPDFIKTLLSQQQSRSAPAGQYADDMDARRRNRITAGSMDPRQQAPDMSGIFSFGAAPDVNAFMSAASSSVDPGGAYAARLADLERRKAAALQAIGFGSQALAGKLTDSRGEIDARYTQGLAEQQADQERNAGDLSQGNAAAAAQNAQLQNNLGIVTDNSRAAEDLQFDQADLAARSQAADQAMRGNQLAQFTLGTRNRDAANFRGMEEQASSGRNFDTIIAELLDQQAAAKSAAQQSGMQGYNQARGNWEQDRNFAYQEWVRQQENDREDAQNLLQYEQEAGQQTAKPSAYEQLMASLQVKDPQTAKTWYNRIGKYDRKDPNSFNSNWGNASPANQAAIRAYLKAAGLI